MNRLTDQRLAKRIAAAVLTAILVFAAVAVALLLRPEAYDARIGLLAVPRTTPAVTERADFGVVVANSLPALVEVAHSPSAVSSAADRVPGAPEDPTAIAEGVTVELVPASGLARLTVRADDPDVAAGLANELAGELVQANLLSPTAALRVLDPVPTVQHASPDLPLALGLALAAGVLAGVAALGAATLWWPHPTRRLRRLLREAGVGHDVVVIRGDGSDDGLEELRLLRGTAGRPLRLVAAEPRLVDVAARLSAALDLEPVEDTTDRRVAVGLVMNSAATSGALRTAIGPLPDPREIVAVILSDGAAVDGSTGEFPVDDDGDAESDPGPEIPHRRGNHRPGSHRSEPGSQPSAHRPTVARLESDASDTADSGRPDDGGGPVGGSTPGDPPEDDPVTGEAAPASAH